MRTDKLLLQSMYDGQPEYAESFYKFVRAALVEYTEDMEVEIVWNFASEEVKEITILVSPQLGIEPISNKLPCALFPISELLDEWFDKLEDHFEDSDAEVEKWKKMLQKLKRDCDRIIKNIDRVRQKDKEEEKRREEFNKLLDERYPHASYTHFWNERHKAEELLKQELENESKRTSNKP